MADNNANQGIMVYIMSENKCSTGMIAANFQNAIQLPPIGFFWDIENIQVPRGKSASALCKVIRKKFLKLYREAEFMCVCDINKENKAIVNELNSAQVTVVHVDATSKNAADEKLRQCMRRFVETHANPATLLLISDDVNFATDLSDFRHRRHVHVILLHRSHAADALLACASEEYDFNELIGNLPCRSPQKLQTRPTDVVITNLPPNVSFGTIRKYLSIISDNCGGKVLQVSKTKAVVSFATPEAAERAQKRMDKEVICKQKISANLLPRDSKEWKSMSATMSQRNFYSLNKSYDDSDSSVSSRGSIPKKTQKRTANNQKCSNTEENKPFVFPKPPILTHNSPNVIKSSRNSSLPEFTNMPALTQNGQQYVKVSNNCLQPENANVGLLPLPVQNDSLKQKQFVPLKVAEKQSILCTNVNPYNKDFDRNSSVFNYGHPMAMQGVNWTWKQSSSGVPNFGGLEVANASTSSAIYVNPANGVMATGPASPVELCITNLDQMVEVNKMKRILQATFREHVMVLHISMILQPDNMMKAIIKVPSMQDAQFAISQLQRKKLGHKRIMISHVSSDRTPPYHVLRSEVVALLRDVPSKKLPLFKFRELYEKRYRRAISISELYKMKEAVFVLEDFSGRTVCLNLDYRSSCSPTDSDSSQEPFPMEKPYCERHFSPSKTGWAEQESVTSLPDVFLSLKVFSPAVHKLLDSHQGSVPLNSFCLCYEAEIGRLPIVSSASYEDGVGSSSMCNPAAQGLQGVPIEHLITCVVGVEIVKSSFVTKVQWCKNKVPVNQALRSISPQLLGPVAVFGREIQDLLKNQTRCLVLFNKFIPVYHHHFGKQCRVSDYGFTKLIDLLEAIPHIIQVLGEGQHRLVTLTHQMQVKRFAADLLRILKSRASKQITLAEFPSAYEHTIEKAFDIAHYGVCDVRDILGELSTNTIVIADIGGDDMLISIPKREQTLEEMEKTRRFSLEVVELLKHTKNCSMPFSKFIPSYHHHFGKQCKVSDHGFTKLIELFEAITVLEVRGSGEQKVLHLVDSECNKIVAERLASVLKSQPLNMIGLHLLSDAYKEVYGHALIPEDFGLVDLKELLQKFNTTLKVIEGFAGPIVILVDKKFVQQASLRVRQLVMEQPNGKMAIQTLNLLYQRHFGHSMDLLAFQTEFQGIVKMENGYVELKPMYFLIRNILILLQTNKGFLSLDKLEACYFENFGIYLRPAQFGYSSVLSFLLSHPEYFSVRGKKDKHVITMNKDNASSLPTLTEAKNGVEKNFVDETVTSNAVQMPKSMASFRFPSPCLTSAEKVLPLNKVKLEQVSGHHPSTMSDFPCVPSCSNNVHHTPHGYFMKPASCSPFGVKVSPFVQSASHPFHPVVPISPIRCTSTPLCSPRKSTQDVSCQSDSPNPSKPIPQTTEVRGSEHEEKNGDLFFSRNARPGCRIAAQFTNPIN